MLFQCVIALMLGAGRPCAKSDNKGAVNRRATRDQALSGVEIVAILRFVPHMLQWTPFRLTRRGLVSPTRRFTGASPQNKYDRWGGLTALGLVPCFGSPALAVFAGQKAR